jgi:hypothetical protein
MLILYICVKETLFLFHIFLIWSQNLGLICTLYFWVSSILIWSIYSLGRTLSCDRLLKLRIQMYIFVLFCQAYKGSWTCTCNTITKILNFEPRVCYAFVWILLFSVEGYNCVYGLENQTASQYVRNLLFRMILTLWRLNFLLNFSTPCIWNVNITGTKKGSIMK